MTAPGVAACPKQMTWGPCGGVADDGRCEIGGLVCPFLDVPLPGWPGPGPGEVALNPQAANLAARLARGGAVVADLPAAPLDSTSLRACGEVLGELDGVLIGDAPGARVQFPPAYRAALLAECGVSAWVGLNTRDRNRVALEGELAALSDLGAGAVHCVTGDHPRRGHRPDARGVFDLDSTALTALAASRGLLVSVAESPAAPPQARRPARLLSKERAGARVCFIDHCGGPEAVGAFIGACRARVDRRDARLRAPRL